MLTLKVDNKDFPEGHEFAIEGLGVFENGSEREVYAEQVEAFENSRRRTTIGEDGGEETIELSIVDAFANDPNVTLSGGNPNKMPEEAIEETANTTDETNEGGGE